MKELIEGSLSGIKVLDFSTLLPGPLATLFLAETGAEVIKIEKPDQGDEMRESYPKWGNQSVSFSLLNRGKKSLTLNLKDPESLNILNPLLKTADIIVEQFRPGVMKRLGLDYDSICNINKKIIYVSITGYGQNGPKSQIAGHDLNYISDTGLLSLSMGEKNNPVVPPALVADIAGGSYPAVINILLALRNRDKNNVGSFIDISMSDGLFPFMFWGLSSGFHNNNWPGNADSLLSGGSPRYNIYRTSDNGYIAAAPLEDRFWKNFCELIELPAKYIEKNYNPIETIQKIRALINLKTKKQWSHIFLQADCCCSIVKSLEEAMDDNHFKYREILSRKVSNIDGNQIPALPIPINNQFRNSKLIDEAPEIGSSNNEFIN